MTQNPPTIPVSIPAALRELAGGRAELAVTASSVRGVLAELARLRPELHRRLCDELGGPRPHINVFVNEDHVRARAGLDTELKTGDVVTLLPAVSGG